MLGGTLDIILVSLAGLLIGSFLNVCIFRMPRDLSVVRPRSHCPGCGKLIRSWDNIPIVSFLLLRGKCRDCGERISWRYPLIEAATALLFFAFVSVQGPTLLAARNCFFAAILLVLISTDLEMRILPEYLTIGGIFAGLLWAVFVPGTSFLDSLLGAVVPAGALWLTGWLFEKIRHKEGLGLGDVVMIAAIGAFLGLRETLLTFMLAAFAGSVTGLVYIRITRKDPGSYHLPLGSFLGAAAIVVALCGDVIVRWYAGLWY